MTKRILVHKIINSVTLKPSKKKIKKDFDGEIIGLEKVHKPKDWHSWVYGGSKNPKT